VRKNKIKLYLSAVLAIILSLILAETTYYIGTRRRIIEECKKVNYNSAAKKVVFLGDSFLVAKPRLSEVVKGAIRSDISILDLSEVGFGPFDYYNKLRNLFGFVHGIDNVVVFVYLGNDILEVYNIALTLPIYAEVRFLLKKHLPGTTSLIQKLKNTIYEILYINAGGKKNKDESTPIFFMNRPDVYNKLFLLKDNEAKKAVEKFEEILLEINELTKKNGSGVIFILIPAAFQVNREYFSIFENNFSKLDEDLIVTDKLQDELKKNFINNNVKYIDLLKEFKEYNNAESLYRLDENNDHWSERAITITANILKENLPK